MTIVGEIKKGSELGYPYSQRNHKLIFHACETCGKPRWVHIVRGQPHRKKCKSCGAKGRIATLETRIKQSIAMRQNPDGKFVDKSGYVWIHLYLDEQFSSMSNARNLVLEHRLVMARYLGRCLTRLEQVHHKNGIKGDNRIENLELVNRSNHRLITVFCTNCELKKEIRLLRLQQKILLEQVKELHIKLMETNHVV